MKTLVISVSSGFFRIFCWVHSLHRTLSLQTSGGLYQGRTQGPEGSNVGVYMALEQLKTTLVLCSGKNCGQYIYFITLLCFQWETFPHHIAAQVR